MPNFVEDMFWQFDMRIVEGEIGGNEIFAGLRIPSCWLFRRDVPLVFDGFCIVLDEKHDFSVGFGRFC